MFKFLSLTAPAALLVLLIGCSSAQKPQTESPVQSTPVIVDKASQSEALVKALEEILLKLNADNDAAFKNYQDTYIRINEELNASFTTDPLAEQKARTHHLENERDYLEKKVRNGEEAKQQNSQVLNNPEYQQPLQDMGLSPEIMLNESVENILIRVQAKTRSQAN